MIEKLVEVVDGSRVVVSIVGVGGVVFSDELVESIVGVGGLARGEEVATSIVGLGDFVVGMDAVKGVVGGFEGVCRRFLKGAVAREIVVDVVVGIV